MGPLNSLQGLISRIPQPVIYLLIATVAVRIYLQFQPADKLKSELIDRLWGILAVYIGVTRFSGILIYPGTLRNMNVFTFLAQPPQNGWVLGLSIALAYVFWSFGKANLLQVQTFYLCAMALLWAGLGFFVYQSFLDGAPYQDQDLLRLALAIVLLILTGATRQLQFFWSRRPARLWLAIGVGMLATSAVVPVLDKWWIFGWEQWIDVVILLGAVLSEGIEDAVRQYG